MEEFVEEENDIWSGIYVEEDEPIVGKDMFSGSNEFVNEIMSVVGPLISVYVNGELYKEIDLVYTYRVSDYIKLFQVVNPGKIEAEKNALKITNIDGSIVEIKPQKERLLNRKEVKDIGKELSLKGRLKLTKKKKDGEIVERYIELDELIRCVQSAFIPGITRGFFVVEDNSISCSGFFDSICISVE